MGWGDKTVGDSKGATDSVIYDGPSANQGDTLVSGPAAEIISQSSGDGYKDDGTTSLEKDIRTKPVDEMVAAEVQNPDMPETTAGDLATNTANKPTDGQLARRFLQDQPHGKITLSDPISVVEGTGSKSKQTTEYTFTVDGNDDRAAEFGQKFKYENGVWRLDKKYKETDISDYDLLTIHYWATGEGLDDLPEGQQLAQHDVLYGERDDTGTWHMYDRRQVAANLSEYYKQHLSGPGGGPSGGDYSYLDSWDAYANHVLTGKGSYVERRDALKAIAKKSVDKDSATESGDGRLQMDDEKAWAMAYQAGFAKSAKYFTKANGGSTGDGKTVREDLETTLESEEAYFRGSEGLLQRLGIVQEATAHDIEGETDAMGEDIRTGKVLIASENSPAVAVDQAVANTDAEKGFKAYCQALEIKDADKAAARSAYDAARTQRGMLNENGQLKEEAPLAQAAKTQANFTGLTQSNPWKTLQTEKARIATIKDKKEKAVAQEKYDAALKSFGDVVIADTRFGQPVWDALLGGDATTQPYAKKLADKTTAAQKARDAAAKTFGELDTTSRGYSQHYELARANKAALEHAKASGRDPDELEALAAQYAIDQARNTEEKALANPDLSKKEKRSHKQEVDRLTKQYEHFEILGHHKTRTEHIAALQEDYNTRESDVLEAVENADEKGLEESLHYDGMPEYEATITLEGLAKWEDETSKYQQFAKTQEKVMTEFKTAGDGIGAVSQGFEAVDGIAKIIEGPENTVGQAQVTAASERREKKAARMEKLLERDVAKNMRDFIKDLRTREKTTIQTALAEGITGEGATRKARMENRYVSVVNGSTFADEYTPDNKGALTESQVAKTDAEADKIAAQAQIQEGRASAVMV